MEISKPGLPKMQPEIHSIIRTSSSFAYAAHEQLKIVLSVLKRDYFY